MRQLVEEKENSEFKPVKLRLKIDFVSYPAREEGLGKSDNQSIVHKAFYCYLFHFIESKIYLIKSLELSYAMTKSLNFMVSFFYDISIFMGYFMQRL